jgi:predicted AAA+ superfamily ATPase
MTVDLSMRLSALAVFRSVLSDPVVSRLVAFLQSRERADVPAAISAYGEFASALYDAGGDLSQHVQDLVFDDENVYVHAVAHGDEDVRRLLASSVRDELAILQEVAGLTPESLREGLAWDGYLPGFATHPVDLAGDYVTRMASIGTLGYGMYARHRAFTLDDAGDIVAVESPDDIRLSDLIDYQREQKIILDNTLALLAGKPAANVLLTGDAGTGKSSTIKAVVNELHDRGLRIIEVRKDQLHDIPHVLGELADNPLKFILFIDDLSFQSNDDNYSAMKAILEGSVSAKSRNVVIYATSNRRHLVKESFSERDGDDVHFNDTMQEIVSLSERFGIHVTFSKPDKKTYLDIVHNLMESEGLPFDPEQLDAEAERYAIYRGGRTARLARQFVDSIVVRSDES